LLEKDGKYPENLIAADVNHVNWNSHVSHVH
jgi:hypothetical protein